MTYAEQYRSLLEQRGVSLRDLGLSESALLHDDALLAIELLQLAAIPILGGDVYFRTTDGIEPDYSNWHSDPISGEDRNAFAVRSCIASKQYIETFSAADTRFLFVLVIDK